MNTIATTTVNTTDRHARPWLAAVLLSCPLLGLGCQTDAQSGALGGAAVGAVAGQIIGGDTGATLLGAAIGAGAGYAVGNEKDKQAEAARQQQNEAELQRMKQEQARAKSQGGVGEASSSTAARPSPLTGTRWKVVSLVAAEPVEYASKVVAFTADTLTCTTTTKDGMVDDETDAYTVVGDALVITRPQGVINAQFVMNGDQLIVNCNEFRAALARL